MHISLKLIFLTIISVLIGVYSLVNTSPEYIRSQHTVTKHDGVDIRTLVSTSISSVQKQNQLLVLTARMNATATSTIKELGMEAWQMNIASGEVQYLVDLKQITAENVTIVDKDITIILPKTALIVKQLTPTQIEAKDNGSWLFSWRSDTKDKLTKHNNVKIQQSFLTQASDQKELAMSQAEKALENLFSIPIKTMGLTHRVIIIFQ